MQTAENGTFSTGIAMGFEIDYFFHMELDVIKGSSTK
jgi:hypothetical protein